MQVVVRAERIGREAGARRLDAANLAEEEGEPCENSADVCRMRVVSQCGRGVDVPRPPELGGRTDG